VPATAARKWSSPSRTTVTCRACSRLTADRGDVDLQRPMTRRRRLVRALRADHTNPPAGDRGLHLAGECHRNLRARPAARPQDWCEDHGVDTTWELRLPKPANPSAGHELTRSPPVKGGTDARAPAMRDHQEPPPVHAGGGERKEVQGAIGTTPTVQLGYGQQHVLKTRAALRPRALSPSAAG
jgi:hypothetical protein